MNAFFKCVDSLGDDGIRTDMYYIEGSQNPPNILSASTFGLLQFSLRPIGQRSADSALGQWLAAA